MTKTDYLLECLTEECAEVIQRVCKAQRFGFNEIQTGQTLNNRERIELELCDLLTVIEMLREEGVEINPSYSSAKCEKVEKYMKLSRSKGILHD